MCLLDPLDPIHICLKSLWPTDTIWRHKSGSTLAQVMACCLTAPSHYLNQCWLIISKVQWHPSESNSQDIPQPSVTEINLKITYLKFCSKLIGPILTCKTSLGYLILILSCFQICCKPIRKNYNYVCAAVSVEYQWKYKHGITAQKYTTYCSWVTHVCVFYLGHHWFIMQIMACHLFSTNLLSDLMVPWIVDTNMHHLVSINQYWHIITEHI